MAIILPARLVFCPDSGLEAHILFSDGSKSIKVATIWDLIIQIQKNYQNGKLVKEEIVVLLNQASGSALPAVSEEMISDFINNLISELFPEYNFEESMSEDDSDVCLN